MPKHALPIKTKIERRVVVDPVTGCWIWQGVQNHYGYGLLSFNRPDGSRTSTTVSRIAYLTYKGPIGEGLHVCHHCDTPLCCNPDHLFLGTQRENLDDMFAKGRDNYGHGGIKYPIDFRIEVAAAGGTLEQVVEEYGVSLPTVKRWRARYRHLSPA